jgi:hypothetical protein
MTTTMVNESYMTTTMVNESYMTTTMVNESNFNYMVHVCTFFFLYFPFNFI